MADDEPVARRAKRKPPEKPAKPDRAAIVKALQSLSVDAGSPDGTVGVSVNTDGVMTRLTLSEKAAKLPPAQLANLVLRTYAQAQRDSAQRSAELLGPLGSAGYVGDRLRWRLKFDPGSAAAGPGSAERGGPEAGGVLRDRSGSWREPEKRAEPESDDEFYEKGVRFDPSW